MTPSSCLRAYRPPFSAFSLTTSYTVCLARLCVKERARGWVWRAGGEPECWGEAFCQARPWRIRGEPEKEIRFAQRSTLRNGGAAADTFPAFHRRAAPQPTRAPCAQPHGTSRRRDGAARERLSQPQSAEPSAKSSFCIYAKCEFRRGQTRGARGGMWTILERFRAQHCGMALREAYRTF